MFKIGEFSRLAQVSVRMLRHYDKLGLLIPSQIDQWTGYRYYTVEQLPRLHRIVALNGLGLSLQHISELLNHDDLSADQLRGMLRLQEARLTTELAKKQAQLAEVSARLAQIDHEQQPWPYAMMLKSTAAQPIASMQAVVPSIDQMGYYCHQLYTTLYQELHAQRIPILEQEITTYHNQEFAETNVPIEVAVTLADTKLPQLNDSNITFQTLPSLERAATLAFEGSFREIHAAVLALLGWVALHNYQIIGPLREFHRSGPAHDPQGSIREPAIIELQLPIAQPT
ncbi:MerR family transcriptional regulator [Herpetosiphon llansteffanensis]|uniref:MerR family transcriptional regulator n=1 Tax=Herpetosiphon llansteffanensis TaxID=2094568 RepID=UPI0013DF0568|nr:MerR family transcriptional regulator [Herpetosiphon llansteffanensis]